MNKVQLQNLIAIADMAQKAGIIQPDDMLPAALSRQAAKDLLAKLQNDADTIAPIEINDKPSEAKHEKSK
jgi:hypothetical protein